MDKTYRILLLSIMHLIWSLFYLLDADAQLNVFTPESLSVREGDTVTLVCTYEPKTEEPLFGALSWQMGDTVLASYNCPSTCSRTNANTDRYRLEVDSMFSGNLTITGITSEDDNTYECVVSTFQGHSHSYMRLVVKVPPVGLKLSDTMTPGGHEEGDIVPVLSRQPYSVTCSTQPGANPTADLEWTSTTAQITQGVKEDQAVTGSKLTMSSREVTFTPSMADHLTSVTCEATHPALDTSLTKFIQLDVQVPPSDVNIMFNSAIISDGETLTLREGTSSTITCESLGTRPASAITWYLDGVQVSSGVGRPEFSPNTDDSRLSDASSSIIIHPTRENHEQVLRCQATTFEISRDTSIRLSVDGPPDPPVITSIPDNLIENQQTSISCQADNGHPSPSFQWFIGNRNLSADATMQVSADVNNRIDASSQLRYLPLREDNGLALECHVTHDALSQPVKTTSDTLVVEYCSISVDVTVCPVVEVGSSGILTCTSGASNPASSLVLSSDLQTTDLSKVQTYFEEIMKPFGTKTVLTYARNFTKEDLEESFICCVSSSPRCSTICSQACFPDVIYPPTTPLITSNKPSGTVSEGTEDLEILCEAAEGRPRPALVWISPDDPSLSPDQGTVENGSQLLMFSELSRANAGIYRCIADNNVPPTSSADHQLIVGFPGTIRNKDDNKVVVLEGSNVILICDAEGNPSPSITWQRLGNRSNELGNGTLVTQSEQKTDYMSVVTSTLIITEVKPEMDNSNFSCVANNTYGADHKVFHLRKTYPELRNRFMSIFISVALIVIFIVIIFVFIRCWLSRKHKRARGMSSLPEGRNTHTASRPSSSFVKPEEKAYADLSITGMQDQQDDYMPLHTYETPIKLADCPPRGGPDCTVEEGISARMDMEHTYATADESTPREDSGERIYINNSVLTPRVV